uniref:Putative secreted protein n=1 Tax=Ixodes ricinus TaxID=34613 RepID=A0A6B0TYB8_IXORI
MRKNSTGSTMFTLMGLLASGCFTRSHSSPPTDSMMKVASLKAVYVIRTKTSVFVRYSKLRRHRKMRLGAGVK